MRVLVACECSGVVRDAFLAADHDAWSCDLKPSDGSHYQKPIDLALLADGWDLMIAHPPCTDLAVSGALRFKGKEAQQADALAFVQMLMDAPIPRICIENPVSIISTRIRKPDQIIQPYQFGHDASKKTCLWLKGLPQLTINPNDYVNGRIVIIDGRRYERWANQTDSGQNRLAPSEHRAADRAKTYEGIAAAMVRDWSAL